MTTSSCPFVLLGLLSSLFCLAAHAGSVSLTNTIGDTLVTSQGTALDSLFKFELGTFGNSFTPLATNTDLWQANWKPFAQANEGAGTFNSAFGAFSVGDTFVADTATTGHSSLGLLDMFGNTPSFTQNDVAYLWVFDAQSLTSTREWALLTSSAWRFPDPNSIDPNAGSFSLTSGSTPVLGNFDPTFTTTPDVTSRLQTASVVPEPGSVLLVAIAGLLARFRRPHRQQA